MVKTWVMLDGLADPPSAQALSRQWSEAGFDNAVDVAGQRGWLAPNRESCQDALVEADMDRAAKVSRRFGVELRDRVGNTFRADNDKDALGDRIRREYKARLAQAIMFGLPVLALQYLAPMLASTGGADARGMLFPWLFQMLLAGWLCYVAAWPILWQGAAALLNLRATGDTLTLLLVVGTFIPSAVGVLSLLVTETPWFGAPGSAGFSDRGPAFHATMLIVTLAVTQRWLYYRQADRLAGRATLMPRGVGRLISLWLLVSVVVWALTWPTGEAGAATAWRQAVMFAMLLPSTLALGAINPWSPRWSAVLPVIGFAAFLCFAPAALKMDITGVRIEIATGFGLIVSAAFALGWSRWPSEPASTKPS